MAEEDYGTDLQDDVASADEQQADVVEEAPAAAEPQGDATDPLVDRTGTGPEDPNDPNYKYWHAAYTQSRQHDRAKYGKLEEEHAQRGEVLRNFYADDAYAAHVVRQRFPQGLPSQGPPARGAVNPTVQLLEESLGSDLAFLAPRLGPVLEQMVESLVKAQVAPLEQRTQQQQAAARKSTEDSLMAELDSAHPGWEARYGKDMQELDTFLNSEELRHPRFGNKYELLLKLVNPDLHRVEAVRSINTAAKSRLTTGRTGRQSQPDPTEAILKAKNSDAFRIAAEAAIRELGQG